MLLDIPCHCLSVVSLLLNKTISREGKKGIFYVNVLEVEAE